jgi:glycosyltransferase involved in cell wall biosynthesis
MDVSFIVIAYNEEKAIAHTVRAIMAQQGLANYEIVLVNDGSRDNTLRIVRDMQAKHPQIKIIDQENKGRGAARAAGVAAATGRYFAFVDGDITLPVDWLQQCMPYMQSYDACGGIAVPDGDVAYVHGLLRLTPKVAEHSTTVTGSNGLFKREVFDTVSFDPKKRNGEDVALGYQITAAGFTTLTVPGLLVEHNEAKTYIGSLGWLFESGRGASRQFYEHKEVRLPDLAFFGFVVIALVAIIACCLVPGLWWLALLVVAGYITASSAMHLHGKFKLARTPLKSVAGLLVNDTLLFAYYLGRSLGMAIEWKRT